MAIKIFLLALPLFLYIGFRLSTAIAHASETGRFPISKKTARLVVFAFILWFYLWPITLWVYQLTGNVRHLFVLQPQLQWQDYLILFPAWWGLISFVEIFPYFLVLDIFGRVSKSKIFSSKKEQPGEKKPRQRWLSYLKIAVALFFLVYVGIRTYWDTNHVRIDKSQVAIENLPEEFEGLKLCLFGDVHMSRYMPGEKLDILKKTLQAGDDDLIFFTGDLNSDGFDFLGKVLKLMCQPKGKLASIACMGDHDYWTAPYKIPLDMEQCGWKFLQDQHHLIPYKGRRILVTGLTYVYSKRISRIELRRLLANAPEADLKILVVHQPRAFLIEIAAQYGYHLALAGHTHGGEVVNHLFWIPFSPGMAETPYCWGHHRYKDLQIVITNGIGRTLAPLRYHAPAQITKLTLVKK
jgi:predicted MPP superfamily phosphohydrolase